MLPNPNSTAFSNCDKNSATWVLAAAVYCKLEHLFFDEMLPRINIVTDFRCNVSQLTKAITGVDYKGGLHSYKSRKRQSGTADDHPGPSKRKASSTQQQSATVQEDMLTSSSSSSSSSDSKLLPGLPN